MPTPREAFLPQDTPIPRWFQLGVGSSFILAAAYLTTVQLDYNYYASRAIRALPGVADARYACTLQTAEPLASPTGGLVYKLTVGVEPGILPDSHNQFFDSPSTKIRFTDGPVQPPSIIVRAPEGATIPHVYAATTDEEGVRTAIVNFDSPPGPESTYSVAVVNAVRLRFEQFGGFLRRDAVATGSVACGQWQPAVAE